MVSAYWQLSVYELAEHKMPELEESLGMHYLHFNNGHEYANASANRQ
jgi:hypothetical protein